MARKPAARVSSITVADVSERLSVVEARFGDALTSLPINVKLQVAEALAPVFEALKGLASQATVDALAMRVASLESAKQFQSGAVRVEQRVRSELQEWARTLFPYAVTIAGFVVALRGGFH